MRRLMTGEGETVTGEYPTSFPGHCLGATISFEEMLEGLKL